MENTQVRYTPVHGWCQLPYSQCQCSIESLTSQRMALIRQHDLCASTSFATLRLLRGDKPTPQLLKAAKDRAPSFFDPATPRGIARTQKKTVQKRGYVRWPNYPWSLSYFAARGQNWTREGHLLSRDTGDLYNTPEDEPRSVMDTCIGYEASLQYLKDWGVGCFCVFSTELLTPRAPEVGFWTVIPHTEVGAALSVLGDLV